MFIVYTLQYYANGSICSYKPFGIFKDRERAVECGSNIVTANTKEECRASLEINGYYNMGWGILIKVDAIETDLV